MMFATTLLKQSFRRTAAFIACTIVLLGSTFCHNLSAQDSAQAAPKIAAPTFAVSAYVDAYYALDNDITSIAGAPTGARQFAYLLSHPGNSTSVSSEDNSTSASTKSRSQN